MVERVAVTSEAVEAGRVIIRPQAGRQEEFLSSPADIVIYGGAAGGGKTWALLLDPLRDIRVPGFRALIFRRTYADVVKPGGLWDEAAKIYPLVGGKGSRDNMEWRFPSGAVIAFGHLQSEENLYRYDGAQVALLAFDQLEHFSERAFWYLQMRNRTTCGVVPRLRATCNPPDPRDEGASWLPKLLSYWISEDGYANMKRAGKIVWIARYNDKIITSESRNELLNNYPDIQPLSMTFIPATVYDNKILLQNDPNYLARLQALPYIERERFLGDMRRGGNWKISAEAGKVFNSAWFQVVRAVPDGGIEVRGWDFAATQKTLRNTDPDYTASVKIRQVGDYYYVVDLWHDRHSAGEIDAVVSHLVERDLMMSASSGTRYRVRWEIEPGSAGIRESERLKRELAGRFGLIDANGTAITGDKIQRARAFAAAAEAGKVRVLAAPWTEIFLSELHGFPDRRHDDIVDAASLAFNDLVGTVSRSMRDKKSYSVNPWSGVR